MRGQQARALSALPVKRKLLGKQLVSIRAQLFRWPYKVLDPMVQTADGEPISESAEYTLSQGSAKATGVVTAEGFVLLKGAVINKRVSAKSLNAGIVKLREKYLSDGHVQDLVTAEDILFSSSSAAADFVLGYSVSGPKTWKAPDGRTLKEVEESEYSGGRKPPFQENGNRETGTREP